MCPYDFLSGVGAFRKTSTADAVARSFLLTPDFAVGKSSFFRRFDEPHFCFRKNGVHESLYHNQKKRTRPIRVCPYDFLSGVRCAPAFFERCGRFTKNCVCSRLHSPQRLTRLCGCCDEPHFCFAKTGFMNPCITAKKKRTRPIRVCPFLAAIQGFEPRQAESEAAVLPLHYIAIPRLYIKPLYYTTFRKFVKGDKC